MARSRPAYSIGSRAVAVAIMTEVLRDASVIDGAGGLDEQACAHIADRMVRNAWDVEYKPNAERLVIVFDAGISDEQETGTGARPLPGENQCAYISNGKQCLMPADHEDPHDLED